MDRIVGVVGLGIMGGAISRNLVAGGWRVLGFDPDPGQRAAATTHGVEAMDSLVAMATIAPVLITSLPGPAALMATAQALDGLPPRVVIETSTLTIEDKEAAAAVLTQAGHTPLDCPLSGTGAQAVNKDLVVYASGDSAAIAALQPLFLGFARDAPDVGVFGNGSRMKFVANLLVAVHNVAAAEAMVLGMRAGLDPDQLVRLAGGGAGASRMFTMRAPMMAAGVYEPPTMRVSTWQKDMRIIADFAASLGAPTPLLAATAPLYDAAMAQGRGGQDTASVCAVLAGLAVD